MKRKMVVVTGIVILLTISTVAYFAFTKNRPYSPPSIATSTQTPSPSQTSTPLPLPATSHIYAPINNSNAQTSTPAPAKPTSTAPTASSGCPAGRHIKMVALIDKNSLVLSDKEVRDYFQYASNLLYDRTGTRICAPANGILRISFTSDSQIVNLLKEAASSSPALFRDANAFTIFTANSQRASTYGGYAVATSPRYFGINDYCNTYSHKGPTINIYGSVIHWGHKYARCGYNDKGEHVSDVSIGGECRNRPGTSCVMHNGYYMCSNATSDYYASDRRLMTITSIIHEIMHHFGYNGNMDHYGTAKCNEYPVPKADFTCPTDNKFQCYFGMCPYTYENFKNAGNFCDKMPD